MPGGDGAPCAISGSDVWYAGGGASMGGSASLGGGGAGAPAEGVDVTFGGTDGLGGGGGGGWLSGRGGAGGSGTVIVAYFVGVTTYTVTFESNGGSTVPKQIVAPNHTATQPPTPTRAGYTFVQWCADSTLTTAFDFATPITANRTLYAKWTMNSYTLIYLSGAYGSLSGTTTQTVQYAASGTAVTAVPMAGATFVKWSDNSTTNPRIDSNVSSNITVTAIFEPPFPGVTILRNGATLVSFYKGSGTWTIPAGLTSVEVLVVGGGGGGGIWSSGSGAGGMYYTENYPVTPGISVGVQVGAGGAGGVVPGQGGNFYGDLGGTSQFDSLFAYGGAAGLGYTDGGDQGGYSTDGGSTIIPGNPGMHYSPMDGNWSTGGGAGGPGNKGDAESGGPGAPCSITGSEVYYAGGGGGNAHGPGGIGGGGSGPAKSGDPTQPGIDGLGGGAGGGWGGPAINAPGGSGIVLVSYFTTSPIYTVSFDSNGGSPVPNNQRVASGYRATQPPTPALPGYTLVGWCTDIGLTTPYNFDTPVTGNLTLYAKWGVETPTVTITSITTDGNGTFTISGMASTDVSVELLHSTDLNAPLSSWATVAGPSAFGPTFSFTVSSTDAQGFFAVRVQ